MTKKIEKLINDCVELSAITTSTNGYPIYELMLPSSQKGYISSSYTAFYTEDEKKLKEFKKANDSTNIQDIKSFLLNNIKDVSALTDLHTNNIIEMSHRESLAFSHLNNSIALKKTLLDHSYGVAHLVIDNEVLIFQQNHEMIRDLFNSNKNLNDPEVYNLVRDKLYKLYISKKIEPEGKIIGIAFDKIMETFIGKDFYKLNDYQRSIFLMLNDFVKEIEVSLKIDLAFIDKDKKCLISFEEKEIEIILPENKTEDLIMNMNGINITHKKVSNMLYQLNEEISKVKVANFIKRTKLK